MRWILGFLPMLLVCIVTVSYSSDHGQRHDNNAPIPGTIRHESARSTDMPVALPLDHDEDTLRSHHGQEAVTSMSEKHSRLGPHFRWTALRPSNPDDLQRANEIVATLRTALEPYRDYRKAIDDGYKPILPNVKQPHYHFTNKWRGIKSAFRFDAEQPTSLLYKKTSEGYELEGAMYTAPKRADEEALHKRIPLSVAQWHAHVQICLPPKHEDNTADWRRFGPKGTIVTEAECKASAGRWVPQLFGWMVHVYPFKHAVEEIWTH